MPLSHDELKTTYDLYIQTGKNVSQVARELGLSRHAVRERILKFEVKTATGEIKESESKPSPLEFPEFPADDITAEQIIEHQVTRFEKRKAHRESKIWFPIKVKMPGPTGLGWVGDPHLDDDGCDWPLLTRHIDIFRETEGLFAANAGDSTNNWVGRLARLYADQEMSRGTGFKLTEWFFSKSGIIWLIILLGNHDEWNYGSDILKKYAQNVCPCEDWEAKFRLVHPNGREVKIWAAHDFKGNSIWNEMHGLLRAAKLRERADIFMAGHRHTSGVMQIELEGGHPVTLMRARGYKVHDYHAMKHGFPEQDMGATVCAVINPDARSPDGLVLAHTNLEEAADYLTFQRKRWEAGKTVSMEQDKRK